MSIILIAKLYTSHNLQTTFYYYCSMNPLDNWKPDSVLKIYPQDDKL